ncbi:MAG: glycosyl hydrolase family 28-related protein [Terriglobia bacterium]
MVATVFFLITLTLGQAVVAQPAAIFNVKDYGAIGNGTVLDTRSINQAIDACAKAGGGTVYFPAGTYLSGTVWLKSTVTLWFASGATLLGAKDLAKYQPAIPGGFGRDWYDALIVANDVSNVALVGPGVVDGNRVRNPHGEERMRGPHAVLFYDCRNITVRNLTIKDSGNYALILRHCEGVNVAGLVVHGGWDGINMHDVLNATISNCRLFTGDDSLAGSYWENVTVSNCILNSSANAIRVGGKNVLFSNCVIYGPGRSVHLTSLRHNTESGFQILPNSAAETTKYATKGPVDNMVLSDITMINVVSPIFIAYSNDAPYSRGNLGVGRIIVNNLTVLEAHKTPIYVSAPPSNPAKSIVFNNVRVSYKGGATQLESEEQGFSPYSILQSFGLYARNVQRLELNNVRMTVQEKDTRPAIFVQNVGTLELDRFQDPTTSIGADTLQADGLPHLFVDRHQIESALIVVRNIGLPSGKVYAGRPFSFTVTVESTGSEGLARIPVQLGRDKLVRSVWLRAGEDARLYFVNVRCQETGLIQVRAGRISKQLEVYPKAVGHPVTAPYREFRNVPGKVLQFGNTIYIRARGDHPVMQYGDQYAAAYVKHGLSRNGVIITKLSNPDLRSSWLGRVGIMVRNDMSSPGQSAGYVVLDSSPSNGSYLEWDAGGNGTLDRHTEFAGHTIWPHWLKLERHGAHFVGYCSTDGQSWKKIGEASVPGANGMEDVGVFAFRDSAEFENLKIEQMATQ